MIPQRVAFLGLGTMGTGMASNLLRACFPLTVYNRHAEKATPFRKAGARVAETPRDAAADADVIVSMVADDEASRDVWLGEHGALAAARRGALLVECSTLTVTWVKELADAAKATGADFLDAPVTGSRDQAAAGELWFMVGGSETLLDRVRPVLSAMARDILHAGPTGSGAMLKLINNFMGGVEAALLAEAMTLIEQSGLDRDRAIELLLNGNPGSPMIRKLTPRMIDRTYTPPHFALKLMRKDLVYARDEAARIGVRLETAESALSLFDRSMASDRGELDLSAIVEEKRAHPLA